MLTLEEKTTDQEYVNIFSIALQKLENKNEGDMTELKLAQFLDNIMDYDYDVVKQQLSGNPNTTFNIAVTQIQ